MILRISFLIERIYFLFLLLYCSHEYWVCDLYGHSRYEASVFVSVYYWNRFFRNKPLNWVRLHFFFLFPHLEIWLWCVYLNCYSEIISIKSVKWFCVGTIAIEVRDFIKVKTFLANWYQTKCWKLKTVKKKHFHAATIAKWPGWFHCLLFICWKLNILNRRIRGFNVSLTELNGIRWCIGWNIYVMMVCVSFKIQRISQDSKAVLP